MLVSVISNYVSGELTYVSGESTYVIRATRLIFIRASRLSGDSTCILANILDWHFKIILIKYFYFYLICVYSIHTRWIQGNYVYYIFIVLIIYYKSYYTYYIYL